MKLYEQWQTVAQAARTQEERDAFWTKYFEKETDAYAAILSAKDNKITGKLSDIAAKFSMENAEFSGFLDGINTSLTEEIDLDALTEETELDSEIDFEKLYYNMLNAKAPWLYGLEEWDGIFDEAKRAEITKRFKEDHIYHAPQKVGRNEPCPCGSGKKYKNCCGKNA